MNTPEPLGPAAPLPGEIRLHFEDLQPATQLLISQIHCPLCNNLRFITATGLCCPNCGAKITPLLDHERDFIATVFPRQREY